MKDSQNKDGLALIVGGLFILALVFATYNYFNKNNETKDMLSDSTQTEKTKETTKSNEQQGDINGEGASTQQTTPEGKTGTITSNTNVGVTQTAWVANNYNKGDIKTGNYTVKSGDTLWEIAEGVYGDGSQWTKILAANKDSVGFLPNGQQALIKTGQTLIIP